MVKLSVIIPAFNSEKYIERAVKSICNQSMKHLEIIIVNDGSKDQTKSIIEKLAQYDSRIKVIHQFNSGVAAARNVGIQCAKGEYITFIDADDYISDDMYEILLRNAETYNADIVECGFFSVDNNGKILSNTNFNFSYTAEKKRNIIKFVMGENSRAFPWNKIYKKNSITNIYFPNFNYSEDYLFNLFVLDKTNIKVTIPDKLYFYVSHNESAVNKPFSNKKLDVIKANETAVQFIKSNYNELTPLAVIRLLDNIRILYIQIANINNQNSKKRLVKIFRQYFRRYMIKLFKSQIDNSKKLISLIFFISPRLSKIISTHTKQYSL